MRSDSCSFSSGELTVAKKHNRLLLLQRRRHRLTEERLRNVLGQGEKVFVEGKVTKACKSNLKENWTNPSCGQLRRDEHSTQKEESKSSVNQLMIQTHEL